MVIFHSSVSLPEGSSLRHSLSHPRINSQGETAKPLEQQQLRHFDLTNLKCHQRSGTHLFGVNQKCSVRSTGNWFSDFLVEWEINNFWSYHWVQQKNRPFPKSPRIHNRRHLPGLKSRPLSTKRGSVRPAMARTCLRLEFFWGPMDLQWTAKMGPLICVKRMARASRYPATSQ